MRDREFDSGAKSYTDIYENYRWEHPEYFNIAEDICDRHALDPERADNTALFYLEHTGRKEELTFRELKRLSDKLANVLRGSGLKAGDRLAILLPQRPETALAHLAAYKLGLVTVPLTVLFRRDALLYRLGNSGARAIVLEAESLPLLEAILPDLPALERVLVVGEPANWSGAAELISFGRAVEVAGEEFTPVRTKAEDPAFLVYTSGTTGNPKGALQAHRYLIGHLPGFELSHDFAPRPGDCFWTPADWSWVGGLVNILLAAWHYGCPVVGYKGNGPFDPERAFSLMAEYNVRNAFIPPTALKMMRQAGDAISHHKVNLRTLVSGGESLGAEMLEWGEKTLRVRINEFYGQTEINYFVGNCQSLWPAKPGSMGRAYPGHRVAILDSRGEPVKAGEVGEVALHRGDDPVFFLEYWKNPQATSEKFSGDWALTGDLAVQDEEGYLWFKGRKDDVIISAGYRFGPAEIEEALLKHPAVALAAVVGSADSLRGQIVKAFIKPAAGYAPSDKLASEIQDFIKENLARHEYPREIEFLEDFPLTTTGKIRRTELRLRELEQKSGSGEKKR